MVKSYSAAIDDWIAKSERRITAVFKDSTQDLIDAAQKPRAKGGNLPVDTGFLRNSMVSGLNGSTSLKGPVNVSLTIGRAVLGDTISVGWTAEYARRIEYGFQGEDKAGRTFNQEGARFVGQAASQWQQFVNNNAARARALP